MLPVIADAGMMSFARCLGVEGITAEYGSGSHHKRVLVDVTFELDRGRSVGIWGPHGAGLTTLGRILAGRTRGFRHPGVRVDDRPPRDREIRLVPHPAESPPAARPRGTVRDHLKSVLCTQHIGADHADLRTRAVLRDFELEELGDAPLAALPRLERRLVEITSVLVHAPAFVVADEPNGDLDGLDALETVNRLLDWSERLYCGVVLLTHDSSEAHAADHTYRIQAKTLVSDIPGRTGPGAGNPRVANG